MMKLGNGYLITLVVMAVNVFIGGAVCKALNISPSTSYLFGFASLFVLFPILILIYDWIDRRRGR